MNKQTLLGERLRRKAGDPRDATLRELDHWKQVSGFDTPEQMVAAVNDRFDKELPRGLAKSLWQLTQRDCIKYERIIRELLALCAREALRIEALSHVVQDDDLRVAMHRATFELRAASTDPALGGDGEKG
jgi:hypothetical protein